MFHPKILVITILALLAGWNSSVSAEFLLEASQKSFSHEELAAFDGTDEDKPIYIALKGIIFDVSSGADFYKPGAGYHPLAGKDASRAVAIPSMKEEDLNDRCDDLTPEQLAVLEELFEKVFRPKYPIVGHMTGGYFYPDGLCCEEEECGPCAGESP